MHARTMGQIQRLLKNLLPSDNKSMNVKEYRDSLLNKLSSEVSKRIDELNKTIEILSSSSEKYTQASIYLTFLTKIKVSLDTSSMNYFEQIANLEFICFLEADNGIKQDAEMNNTFLITCVNSFKNNLKIMKKRLTQDEVNIIKKIVAEKIKANDISKSFTVSEEFLEENLHLDPSSSSDKNETPTSKPISSFTH